MTEKKEAKSTTETNSKWNSNNLACVNTWAFLRVLEQYRNVFKTAGVLKMEQLNYYNAAASASVNELEAKSIATTLDRMFRFGLLAKFEQGATRKKAIEGMTKTISTKNKTVAGLAAVVDGLYRFRGEV